MSECCVLRHITLHLLHDERSECDECDALCGDAACSFCVD